MKPIIIPIHSFVALITNSSSETYVSADKNTVDAIRRLVDSILKSGGSDKKCDDLFKVELSDRKISVSPLIITEESAIASLVLSRLTDLFEITSEYNG